MAELRDHLKDISSESQRFIDDAQERAAESTVSPRISSAKIRHSSMVGAGVAIGLVGFLLGRASKSD